MDKNINIKNRNFLHEHYNPDLIEKYICNFWEENNIFKINIENNKENFCITAPPPNITGNLHIGHAFQQTIIDILIRYHRMNGKNTLFQFGTDHAGIATQMIIENKIKIEENKNKNYYGRKKFIEKIWNWKKKIDFKINEQIKKLGYSIDLNKKCFTMDENFSNTVKKVFINLYKNNLIYRKKRLVNWDTELKTAISDLEIEKKTIKGLNWYIKYNVVNNFKRENKNKYLVVCTSRPETIFSDSAIAVHPDDIRYKDFIGKQVILPLVDREIPIIGDDFVDINKGTGCVKISPGHNFEDYEVALRHNLPIITIFDFNGKILKKAKVSFSTKNKKNYFLNIPKSYQGLEKFLARKNIIEDLKKINLLKKVKKENIVLNYGDRSGSLIEPMLTNQWYLRTKFLSKQAYSVVKNGFIKFVSKQYENMYFSWIKEIKDWCISRQLWWGHRIPVWYDENNNVYVGYNEDQVRKKYNIKKNIVLNQDEDVLDTWFSSSLWTFSSLGWIKNSKLFRKFHPTNVLISGFDIIFFWISRMIMLTMYTVKDKYKKGQIPFKFIYITGLILDKNGNKMSKSKGNVIDPIDIINGISLENLILKRTKNMIQPKLKQKIIRQTKKEYPNGICPYGSDALRFTFSSLSSIKRNINFNIKHVSNSRNFCNKIWNASRYILVHLNSNNYIYNNKPKFFSILDRWINSQFNNTVKLFHIAIRDYRFDIASNILYEFTWFQFCDWYIELSKLIFLSKKEKYINSTYYTLVEILKNLLKLAHPIIPFMTEIIWKNIKKLKKIKKKTILLESFPVFSINKNDKEAVFLIELIKKIIIAIRKIKLKRNILYNKKIDLFFRIKNIRIKKIFIRNFDFILIILPVNSINFLKNENFKNPFIFYLINEIELFIPIKNLVKKEIELKILNEDLLNINKKITNIKKILKKNNISTFFIKNEKEKFYKYKKIKKELIKQKEIIDFI